MSSRDEQIFTKTMTKQAVKIEDIDVRTSNP